MEIDEENIEEDIKEDIEQNKNISAPGLPILDGIPLPLEDINSTVPDYHPKACRILDFYLKIRQAPLQVNTVDNLFKDPELNRLAQLINNTGLSFTTVRTIEKMMKRLYINDLDYLFSQINIKEVSKNTTQIIKPLTNLNIRIQKTKRDINLRIKSFQNHENHSAVNHEQIRLSRFNKISDNISLILSRIHVAHAKLFEPQQNRCTIL